MNLPAEGDCSFKELADYIEAIKNGVTSLIPKENGNSGEGEGKVLIIRVDLGVLRVPWFEGRVFPEPGGLDTEAISSRLEQLTLPDSRAFFRFQFLFNLWGYENEIFLVLFPTNSQSSGLLVRNYVVF